MEVPGVSSASSVPIVAVVGTVIPVVISEVAVDDLPDVDVPDPEYPVAAVALAAEVFKVAALLSPEEAVPFLAGLRIKRTLLLASVPPLLTHDSACDVQEMTESIDDDLAMAPAPASKHIKQKRKQNKRQAKEALSTVILQRAGTVMCLSKTLSIQPSKTLSSAARRTRARTHSQEANGRIGGVGFAWLRDAAALPYMSPAANI